MSAFYITTPIYYVNDVPHLGHAYTTIVCDALARFHRMRGDATRFLTGTDEHGQKVQEAATKRGLTPQQLVDDVAPRFAETWATLGISNDDFIRTTEARHKRVVDALWHRLSAAGDIYLASYQGWYCVGCEAFYTESQLIKDGEAWLCEIHKTPVAWVDKERSWFFRLSKYAEPLLAHIEANPGFIQPAAYRSEIVSFLRGGLRDLSVSRTSFSWGIPVPEADPEGTAHVIYVWLDALVNYYSALCAPAGADPLGGPLVDEFWRACTHVVGKDILRFHSVYWPAFLLSAGLPLPARILAHGWWTVRGEKISKSMPATKIAPVALAAALAETAPFGLPIGIDAMRYYLLREVPLGNDGDFTFESLFNRFNADLANDLGNLVNRSLTLLLKLGVPNHDEAHHTAACKDLEAAAVAAVREGGELFEAFQPSRALEAIWRLVAAANRFVDQTQPWALAKAKSPELPHVLWCLSRALWVLSAVIAPVLPATAAKLRGWLGDGSDLRWPTVTNDRVFVHAPALTLSPPTGALFPRLDEPAQAAILAAVLPGDVKPAAAPAPAAAAPAAAAAAPAAGGALTYDDFMKTELRAGVILTAAAVPKAKKLLHLSVDLGEAQPRSIVAGIAERYQPAELVGKQVIVVANLAPATIRGIRSEGMILAAGDDAILGLSAIDPSVPPGTRVR